MQSGRAISLAFLRFLFRPPFVTFRPDTIYQSTFIRTPCAAPSSSIIADHIALSTPHAISSVMANQQNKFYHHLRNRKHMQSFPCPPSGRSVRKTKTQTKIKCTMLDGPIFAGPFEFRFPFGLYRVKLTPVVISSALLSAEAKPDNSWKKILHPACTSDLCRSV